MVETVITSSRGTLRGHLREVYEFRELLAFLVWKDIKVQFAQTVLGFGWLVLRPLLNVIVLTIIFGKIARLPSDNAPYLLFVLAGIVPWSYFSGVVGKSSMSLVANSALLGKVYFPRLYIPLSIAISGLAELLVTFLIFLVVAGAVYGRAPAASHALVFVPLLLLLVLTFGVSLWLSALAIDFRDVRHASQYLLQMLMFAAPVIWPVSLVAARFGARGEDFIDWYSLYPLVGIIEAFRSILLGTTPMPWLMLGKGALVSVAIAISGFVYFRRREQLLADRL